MSEPRRAADAIPATAAEETGAAAHWRQTLWAMVAIQFVMTAAVMAANLAWVYWRVPEFAAEPKR